MPTYRSYRGSGWVATMLALGAVACGDGPLQLKATRLAITVPPNTVAAGTPLAPAVHVMIQDASGNPVTTATSRVEVRLGTNPAGGTLSGATAANAVRGVATFADLQIDKAGIGYTLVAAASGLAEATSFAFDIAAGPAAKLAFTVQPGSASAGAPIAPAVQVAVQDAFGNLVTTATHSVVATIGTNPSAGTLSGTTTANAVKGVATFSDLSIDNAGTGYALAASATGLTGATSAAFEITPRLIFTTVATGGAGQGSHSCAVTDAGAIYCWGFNGRGQLGDNTHTNRQVPTLVQAPTGASFQTVSAGGQHTCAVTTAGDGYCWGRGEFGRLGDGTGLDQLAPVRVAAPAGVAFASVSAGADGHSCGLATSGAVYCWGYQGNGQLGDNSGADQSTPALVQASPGVSFTAVTTGSVHSCALASSGAVYCWGDNSAGQLGDNTTLARPTPVQAIAPPGVNFAQVDAGSSYTCAVTTDGATYCWGDNSAGQLGDSTTLGKMVPTVVHSGLRFAILSSGGVHTCAVTTTGAGYCWGFNGSGEIGDNTTQARLVPTAVAGTLSFSIPSAGPGHSCAIAKAPSAGVYCWGNNSSGQLGDGTTTGRLVPTQVPR